MSLFSQSAAGTACGAAESKQRVDGVLGRRSSSGMADGGGRTATPTPSSRLVRLRSSIWWPAVAKGAAITAGMLALAAIGAVFTLRRPPGVPLAHGTPLVVDSAWIQPKPADAPHAHGAKEPSLSGVAASDSASPNCDGKDGKDCPKADAPPSSPGITADGKVILNVANADELTRLPGVGKKRAQAIIELRNRLKRFKSPTDLLRVKGIGVKGLHKMLPHLVLDPT